MIINFTYLENSVWKLLIKLLFNWALSTVLQILPLWLFLDGDLLCVIFPLSHFEGASLLFFAQEVYGNGRPSGVTHQHLNVGKWHCSESNVPSGRHLGMNLKGNYTYEDTASQFHLIIGKLSYVLFEFGTFISEHGLFCLHIPLRDILRFLLWHLINSNIHLFGYVIPSDPQTAFSLSIVREQALGAQSSWK